MLGQPTAPFALLAALVGEFSRGVMVEAYLADVVGMREHCGVNCGSLTPRIGNVVNASYSSTS